MSFSCQPIFFYLRSELAHKTENRVKKVIRTTISVELVLYLLISITGYLSLGAEMVPEIFTLRKTIRKKF